VVYKHLNKIIFKKEKREIVEMGIERKAFRKRECENTF
jgi:hypothetical protein